jgi:hybrid polyketide synthase/nonribosomal peptide synthetase ACE1
LNALYTEKTLPPVKIQFSDFAKKQRQEVENGSMAKDLEYWKQQFTTIPAPLPLFPMAKVNSRQIMTSYEQEESEEIVFDEKTMGQIKEICRQTGATKFHFFLTCLKAFLFRYLDVDDLCIGLADANRGDTDTDFTMGYLLNLLPLRFQRDNEQDFAAAVKEAREASHAALSHSKIPFDILLDNLDIPRSATSTPLFQVFMDYRQINATMPLLGAQSFGKQLPGRVGYDLMLDITDISGHELRVNFKTQKKLYSESSANILLKSFCQLVKSIASNSKIELDKVPIYNAADVKTSIELGRGMYPASLSDEFPNLKTGPTMPLVWPVTISHRIDEMTLANAESIALKDGVGNSYTYAAMAKRVDAVALALASGGAKEGSLVAVFQEPTADWIISLQAIWKIGGVYVPLELRNGLARLAMIVADAKPDAVLCHAQTSAEVSELNPGSARIINVSEVANIKKTVSTKAAPHSPAMVLYSSGTTGIPKGIVIPHYALRNFIEVSGERYGIGRETIMQQTAYSFDLAISEVLFGLGNGGSLYVASVTQRMDPVEIINIIANENITFTVATPSEYSAWIRFGAETLAGSNWKIAKTIGEALTQELALNFRSLKKSDLRLINFYGPAEITIACHVGIIDYNTDKPITIGYTLPNYQSYIMDRNLEPVPIGVSGEIVIGGAGVTTGYLNNEKLTNRQFIPNTYAPTAEWPNLYRTGDQGRQLPDGSVVYEGRIAGDSQIKLRGIRIELKDIESTIVKVSEGTIYKAVASIRGNRDSEFIVAHAEFAGSFPEDQKDQYLSGLLARLPLPKYMCPAMIIPLDAIPLNNHAKVDRRAVNAIPLPLAQSGDDSSDVLSQTELELKAIWENVISSDIADTVSIGANTDFFRIGGNSLLLVRVQAKIREFFDAAIAITTMFEATTLRAMSAKVDAATSAADVINWEREITLEEALFKTPSTPSKAPSTGLNVLLTGSTGYLGRYLLKQLVGDERVARIHALPVRKDNPKNFPRDVLKQSDKITPYYGNLALPMLGLPESTWTGLSKTVDVIIHSGCDRAMSDYYQVLRAGNFGSTKELTKLALGRQIPIHYISGNGVLDLEGAPKTGSVAAARLPTNGSNGYIASKWVSEVYLEKAAEKFGLPVHIHRVVSAPEKNQQPTPEVLKNFSDIAIAMNAMPDRSRWNGSMDVIFAPTLAKTICDSAVDSDADVPAFVHYPAEARLNMEEVEEYLDDRDNRRASMEVTPTHLWAGEAKLKGLQYHLASQNMVIGGPDGFALKR